MRFANQIMKWKMMANMKIEYVNIYYNKINANFNYSTWETTELKSIIFEIGTENFQGWGEAGVSYPKMVFKTAPYYAAKLINKNPLKIDELLTSVFFKFLT